MKKDSSYENLGLRWLVYPGAEKRFAYRLFIEEEHDKFLQLSAYDRWPGPGKKIFCKLEGRVKAKDLPEEDRVALSQGIYVNSLDELYALLESYSS